MNEKPEQAEYYRLMDSAVAAQEKIENDKNGGVSLENGQMEFRGPNKTNVARLPSVVRDPGFKFPVIKTARGVDLDGNDGSKAPPAGICPHRNYVSEDGRNGIDNPAVHGARLYQGLSGPQGLLPAVSK